MKKYILLALCMLFVTLLFAQGSYTITETEKANKLTKQMQVDLNLSQDQSSQIQTVNLEVVRRLNAAIMNDNDKVLLKSNIQSINVFRDIEYKRILSPQQMKKIQGNKNGRNCK